MRLPGFVALLLFTAAIHAAVPTFERSVVVVDFNDRSAEVLKRGMNRAYLADVTEKLLDAKARAVVIKVFLDSPSTEDVDARLEKVMRRGRVFLQASVSSAPPVTSELEERFAYRGPSSGVKAQISGKTGWLPIARFQAASAKVCFADVQDIRSAPVVEELAGTLYKSLYTCILEEAAEGEMSSLGPMTAAIGGIRLPVTPAAGVSIKFDDTSFPQSIAAEDVLLGKDALGDVAGKIVIVTYTGSRSPTLAIDGMQVKVHQAFLAVLRDVFRSARAAD